MDLIQRSGKTLTLVFISGGDPDFYFGLEPIEPPFRRPKSWQPNRSSTISCHTKDAKAGLLGADPRRTSAQDSDSPYLAQQQHPDAGRGNSLEIRERDTHQAYLLEHPLSNRSRGVLVVPDNICGLRTADSSDWVNGSAVTSCRPASSARGTGTPFWGAEPR